MSQWPNLLDEAQAIVEDKVVYRRFIDGTPLANDIAVWMADFAVMVLQRHKNDPWPAAPSTP